MIEKEHFIKEDGSTRQNQYDLLRIIAMLLVVFIHAVTSKTSTFQQTVLYIAGIAVPVFFLLSGGFILCRYNTLNDLKKYYKGRINKIVLPAFIFELFYFVSTFVFDIRFKGVDASEELSELIDKWLNFGIPGIGYHLWFMNALIPFYFIAPLLIFIRKKNIKIYFILSVTWIIFTELNFYLEIVEFPWYLSFISYGSFMMLGDLLKNFILPKINVNKYIFLLICSVCIATEIILKIALLKDAPISIAEFILHDGTNSSIVIDPNARQILNLLAAIMIFCFFNNIVVKRNFSKTANFCLYVYLVHYAIEWVCLKIIENTIRILNMNISTEMAYIFVIRALMSLALSSFCIILLNKIHYLLFKKQLY